MIANFILRLSWMISLTHFDYLFEYNLSDDELSDFIFAYTILELVRRIIWNIFKIEYEHIKNYNYLNAV